MDKLYNYNFLRKQWSDKNRVHKSYMAQNRKDIAKIGVAWVVRFPNEYFSKPVGWEVEIIDTALGISERSKKLLRWLRHPPTNLYDNIYAFNDRSEILLYNSHNQHNSKMNFIHSLPLKEPKKRFNIPQNEYEIFRKTCCECKEKSFKNSSTESKQRTLQSVEHIPYLLNTKYSYFDLAPTNIMEGKTSYYDFEQELNNQILGTLTESSLDYSHNTIHSITPNSATSKKKNDYNGQKEAALMDNHEEEFMTDNLKYFGNNEKIYQQNFAYDQENNGKIVKNENNITDHIQKMKRRLTPTYNQLTASNNKRESSETSRRRSTGPHIPSVDIFDDSILTRGTSLEQYRSKDRDFLQSTVNNSEFKRQNGHQNHHKHRHRNRGSREVATDTSLGDNL